MDLKGIISISGMSGLYKIVATNKNGFIVESFQEKKRFAVSSAQRVSTLEDITIYTEEGDVPLKEVLKKLDEKAGKDINPDPRAEPDQMRKDMEAVLPEYDKERVYNSDLKKLFTWYSILKESDFSFEDEPEKAEETHTETTKEKEKKTAKKETSAAKEEKAETSAGKKPTKKTAAKTEDKPSAKTKTAARKKTSGTTPKAKTTAPKTSKAKTATTKSTTKKK